MCVGEKLHVVIFVLTMVISLKGWRKERKSMRGGQRGKLEEEERRMHSMKVAGRQVGRGVERGAFTPFIIK